MTNFADRLTKAERDQSFVNVRPRDAATLILLDRATPTPKVLMGRRHAGHKFMPGKFVFPGGRVEPYDGRMAASGELPAELQTRLMHGVQRPSAAKARALALAAVRETCEETGLLLGRRSASPLQVPSDAWAQFAEAGIEPDLDCLHFVARAITPPRRPKRFDTRFFAADATAIGHRIEGVVGPDTELVELVWVPIAEAKQLDLPTITTVVLDELERRTAEGMHRNAPVPFYRMLHGRFTRAMI